MMRRWTFWVAFAAAALLIAGGGLVLRQFQPGRPGLATLRGCEVVESIDGEQLTGDCIAQHAAEHAMANRRWPTTRSAGRHWHGRSAGVIGVAATIVGRGWRFPVDRSRAAGPGDVQPTGRR